MWISKEIVPHLIKAVQITFDEELAVYEKELEAPEKQDMEPEGHLGPNDLVILNSFVLPILKEFEEKGFDSGEIINKGFHLMIYLIPWYLNTLFQEINKSHYGMLARIFYQYSLNEMSMYLTYVEDEHLKENVKNFNAKMLSYSKSIVPES